MIKRTNGRLRFCYDCPKKTYKKLSGLNFKLSLLVGALIGLFLLPQLAYLAVITPEKLIELTNRERQAAGLNPLTANQLLTQAATRKGEAILETNTFKHTISDKKFSAWVRDAGYNYAYVGENLAIDFITDQGVVNAWKNSPPHKQNFLSPYYQETGVAAVSGQFQGQATTVVVQIFGAPAMGSAAPWADDFESGFLNSSLTRSEINLFDPRFKKAENLLTHAIISRELLPLDNKLVLPADNYPAYRANTFMIRPSYHLAVNNFLIIIAFLTATYLFIFLYSYYFFKINKLIST